MNLAELREAVRTRCAIATNDSRYAEIDDRINEANHGLELAGPGGWDWLRQYGTTTTVADQEYLTFEDLADVLSASGIRAIVDPVKAAFGDGYDNLRREQKSDLDDAFGAVPGSSSTTLQYYAVEGQRVWFYPTPSDEVSIKFTAIVIEPELDADDDSPLLPPQYHRTLVSAASDLMLQSLGRTTDARVQADAATAGLQRMFGAARPVSGSGRISSSVRR